MPKINLKHIFRFDRFRSSNNPEKQVSGDNPDMVGKDLNQRMDDIYGQDRIKLQLLYEKWIIKDDWRLKDEALPLLLAIDPAGSLYSTENGQNNIQDELWFHARDCVEQGLLNVINREQPPGEWRVKPVDVYHWSKISRIEIPETLDRLMDFVVNTVKMETTSVEYDKNRENILGMALAIVSACPDQCKNDKGQITAEKILELIEEKHQFWPENPRADVPLSGYTDLINKWLKTIAKD